MKQILILGGSSYIGQALFAALGPEQAVATYCRSPFPGGMYFDALTMELHNLLSQEGMPTFSHAVILYGETNVNFCAENVLESHDLNVMSIARAVNTLVKWDIKPVFTSSEAVFNGTKGNYTEADAPTPILTYGHQKVAIESYTQANCSKFTILRLSKVLDTLLLDWLGAITQSETIRCARDYIFSPICLEDVVTGIVRAIQTDCQGIYHLANPQTYSRLEALEALLLQSAEYLWEQGLNPSITQCSIHDFDFLEKRPLNVSLNPAKWLSLTGQKITPVEEVCKILVKKHFTAQ